MVLLFESRDRGFDEFGALALLPRRPVEAPQTVEYRAADFVFRIGLQFYVVARVITAVLGIGM